MSIRTRRASKRKQSPSFLPNPFIWQVRQAVGLSAVCVALAATPQLLAQSPPELPLDPLYRQKLTGTGKEIVFIDVAVEDYERLTGALPHGLEIVLLDSRRDALVQITEALSRRPFLDSVHLISHGAPGALTLGGRSYTAADLERARNRLAVWFNPLVTAGAGRPDILIYGCNVGAGDEGKDFLSKLADLTGADVAASDDLTGSPLKGGDWELEVATGLIETRPSLISGAVNYPHTLATFNVSNTNDAGAGSLRQAILDANASGGADTVDVSGVFGTITLNSGELLITGSVTVTGPGSANLTIDGSDSYRIFNINDGNDGVSSPVTITGLTLTNGFSGSSGGAIFTRERLTVQNSVITGNTAGVRGGGVYVASPSNADVSISDSTISYNSAGYDGGGIYFRSRYGSSNIAISGSTISNNSANDDGGGLGFEDLNSSSTVTISGTTISNNYAGDDGGGIRFDDLSSTSAFTISDSTISNNSAYYDGGGIYFDDLRNSSSVTISGSTISGNTAYYDRGGGIYFDDLRRYSTVSISGTTISDNSANDGGGLSLYGLYGDAQVTLAGSTVSGNSASNDGGGIYLYRLYESGKLLIAGSTISGNTAGGDGGGIYLYYSGDAGVLELSNSTVSGNSAGNRGGGLMLYNLYDASTVLVENSTLSGNSAGSNGGGIYLYYSDYNDNLQLAHSTVTGNFAGLSGGGLFLNNGGMQLDHTIVAGNNADGAFYYGGGNDLYSAAGNNFEARFSLIGNVSNVYYDLTDTQPPSLITGVDVSEVLNTVLGDNGGPTLTHDLLTGSLAVDAGDLAFVPPPLSDQRGLPRVAGSAVDIGAVEFQAQGDSDALDDLEDAIFLDNLLNPPKSGGGAMPLAGLMLAGLAGLWRRIRRRPEAP